MGSKYEHEMVLLAMIIAKGAAQLSLRLLETPSADKHPALTGQPVEFQILRTNGTVLRFRVSEISSEQSGVPKQG